MSSYVAVTGIPTGETCSIFGLTPQEIRYLQVRFLNEISLQNELARTSRQLIANAKNKFLKTKYPSHRNSLHYVENQSPDTHFPKIDCFPKISRVVSLHILREPFYAWIVKGGASDSHKKAKTNCP